MMLVVSLGAADGSASVRLVDEVPDFDGAGSFRTEEVCPDGSGVIGVGMIGSIGTNPMAS